MKGTYLLLMELQVDTSLLIGNLGVIDFQKGYYAYVGSALNGLEQRIQRHLRKQKKIHWHIDYLRPFIELIDVFYKESVSREECTIAQVFERNFIGISGFGCSDCSCTSHLFLGSVNTIRTVAASISMDRYPMN